MLLLLSPSKKLLPFRKPYLGETTNPIFQQKTLELMTALKTFSPSDIGRMMHLSDALAKLNYERFQAFQTQKIPSTLTYPAVFLFRGDVYESLQADTWDTNTITFANEHLLILSGLYGLLRPLDAIQAYRLEMGTRLRNSCGKNLYDFWKKAITEALNQRLSQQKNPLLLNLASVEYADAIDKNLLNSPMLTIHFKEQKGNELKVIGIHAKKARGAMANYILTHQVDDAEAIKKWTLLNYRYCEKSSDEHHFNFIRSS